MKEKKINRTWLCKFDRKRKLHDGPVENLKTKTYCTSWRIELFQMYLPIQKKKKKKRREIDGRHVYASSSFHCSLCPRHNLAKLKLLDQARKSSGDGLCRRCGNSCVWYMPCFQSWLLIRFILSLGNTFSCTTRKTLLRTIRTVSGTLHDRVYLLDIYFWMLYIHGTMQTNFWFQVATHKFMRCSILSLFRPFLHFVFFLYNDV